MFVVAFFLIFINQSVANDSLLKAEKAYDSKKYTEAVNHYERLIKEGFKSYQLYFNLGNSYYRSNEIGKAIYYYELARKIEPNDEDISINLSKASARTIDRKSMRRIFLSALLKPMY